MASEPNPDEAEPSSWSSGGRESKGIGMATRTHQPSLVKAYSNGVADNDTDEDIDVNNAASDCAPCHRQCSFPPSLSSSWPTGLLHDCSDQSKPNRWKKAFMKLRTLNLEDPWSDFPLKSTATETAVRHRYSAIKKKWVQDEVQVKLESLPFDHGAMRECFRLKKLCTTGRYSNQWDHASNYVAKRYISSVDRNVYFEDVRLQMEAKLWGEEYNRQNPPKKVDMFQLSVLEFIHRPDDTPLYHIEHLMEGDYRKYNSNSGFVDDQARNTPQAFSHFTFERSGHRLLVVDIQGVGDLYTDPQLHTADGQGYGDGNLGPRGMALFFYSHRCNPICQALGLDKFDLTEAEITRGSSAGEAERKCCGQGGKRGGKEFELSVCIDDLPSPGTVSRGDCLTVSSSPTSSFMVQRLLMEEDQFVLSPTSTTDYHQFISALPAAALSSPSSLLRERALSGDSGLLSWPVEPSCDPSCLPTPPINQIHGWVSNSSSWSRSNFNNNNNCWVGCRVGNPSPRVRTTSECSDVDADDRVAYHHAMRECHKPTGATHPTNLDQEMGHSVLGQIHHEFSRLHESGRFVKGRGLVGGWSRHGLGGNSEFNSNQCNTGSISGIDWEAVLFHERHAAQLGCLEAVINMARYCLSMPSHLLQDCPIPPLASDRDAGLDYLWRAAMGGDRRSMIELARLLDMDTGTFLGPSSGANWGEAVLWYQRAVDAAVAGRGTEDEGLDAEGRYDSADDLQPVHQLLARMAAMYAEGGPGLPMDTRCAGELYTRAAEAATTSMKGRLAAKYYELAEECFSREE